MEAHQAIDHFKRGAEIGKYDIFDLGELETVKGGGTRFKRRASSPSDVAGYRFVVAKKQSVLFYLAQGHVLHLIEGDTVEFNVTAKGYATGLSVFQKSVAASRLDRNYALALKDLRRLSFAGDVA